MNRKPSTRSKVSAAAVLSAGVLLAGGHPATAQGAAKTAPPSPTGAADRSAAMIHIKYAAKFEKWRDSLCVAGMLQGAPVFKTAQGEFFQVDANTGDLKFHTAESLGFMKMHSSMDKAASSKGSNAFIKFDGIKGEQRVSVAGVDAQGHVIQENSRHERFYLGPNGDMVFVK